MTAHCQPQFSIKGSKIMAKQEKLVQDITSMDEDFAKWYTDIVKKAELVEYTSVKGCMVIRPYGYAIWENIQRILDKMFKDTGHENVCMPMFIPESLRQRGQGDGLPGESLLSRDRACPCPQGQPQELSLRF